jgi:hypothetical protein
VAAVTPAEERIDHEAAIKLAQLIVKNGSFGDHSARTMARHYLDLMEEDDPLPATEASPRANLPESAQPDHSCGPGCPKCAAEYLDAKERAESAQPEDCPKCRHAQHEPGCCGVTLGTGYFGPSLCQCGVADRIAELEAPQ